MRGRTSCHIDWRGRPLVAVFDVEPADQSVGIMGDYPDDITLHDPVTLERMQDLEKTFEPDEWDTIAQLIVEGGGCASEEEDYDE